MIIGLRKGTVKLLPYNPEWEKLYEQEEISLRSVLEKYLIDIQHIGSTSVPGLDAKPIIDLALIIETLKNLQECIELLESLDYEYHGEYGLPGRHFFTKGDPTTHHLHVVERGSVLFNEWLFFRDTLRRDREKAEEYNQFKRRLAQRFASDRDSYTAGKGPFIEKVLKNRQTEMCND